MLIVILISNKPTTGSGGRCQHCVLLLYYPSLAATNDIYIYT